MGICYSQDWPSPAVLPLTGHVFTLVFSAALDVGVLDSGVRKRCSPSAGECPRSANPTVDVTLHSKYTEPEGPELIRQRQQCHWAILEPPWGRLGHFPVLAPHPLHQAHSAPLPPVLWSRIRCRQCNGEGMYGTNSPLEIHEELELNHQQWLLYYTCDLNMSKKTVVLKRDPEGHSGNFILLSHWTVAVSVLWLPSLLLAPDPGCVQGTWEMHSGTVVLMAELVTLKLVLFRKFLRKHLFNCFGQPNVVFLILLTFGETKSSQENTCTCLF